METCADSKHEPCWFWVWYSRGEEKGCWTRNRTFCTRVHSIRSESGFVRKMELNVGCVERVLSGHVCDDFEGVTTDIDMKRGVYWRLYINWTIYLEIWLLFCTKIDDKQKRSRCFRRHHDY